MVDCSQFLDSYSEFRDGELEHSLAAAFETHLVECCSCARYHRIVCRGVEVFREIPQLKPSDDFLPRLQHRIFHLDEELRRPGRYTSGVPTGVMFAIAALLAAAAWLPMVWARSAPVMQLPAVAARAPQPEPVPVLFRSGPLLAPPAQSADLRWSTTAPAANTLFFRYSPMGATTVYPASYRP